MKTARIDEIHSWQFGTEKERCEWLKPGVQKELSDLHREIHVKLTAPLVLLRHPSIGR